MGCSNCFNGCAEIISDQCIKYTGVDIPALDIENGDSLAVVEKAITDFILTAIDGTGILPTIDAGEICTLVDGYLPSEGDLTLNDFLSAIIQSVCAIDIRVTANKATLDSINAEYSEGCLEDISDNTDTHEVLQAVITKLCSVDTTLTNLIASLPSTYVALADLDALIAAYIASSTNSSLQSSRMTPYVANEYYGPLSGYPTASDGFAVDGSGYGAWLNVYLCNGSNNTPDKRGRIGVGVTDGSMGGGAMSSDVDPTSGNPSYSLVSTGGSNTVTLTSINQIPVHTHIATPVVTVSNHTHYTTGTAGNQLTLTSATPIKLVGGTVAPDDNYNLSGTDTAATIGKTSENKSTVDVAITNANAGGTASHANVQPVIGCYFVMYIP